MKKNTLIYLVSILALSFGCNKNEDPDITTILDTSSDILYANPLDYSGTTMEIKTKKRWTVKSSSDWCAISDTAGEGNKSIVVVCQNNLSAISRKATISIQVEGKSKSVVVKQSEGTPLLNEGFTDDSGGWKLTSSDTISTKINEGFYRIRNTCVRNAMIFSKNVSIDYTGNFAITSTYKSTSGRLPFGLVFGLQDMQNYYSLITHPQEGCFVIKNQNGISTTLVSTKKTFPKEIRINLLKSGNTCEVYINESKVGNFSFTAPSGTYVGFYSYPKTEISVDNIKVIQL